MTTWSHASLYCKAGHRKPGISMSSLAYICDDCFLLPYMLQRFSRAAQAQALTTPIACCCQGRCQPTREAKVEFNVTERPACKFWHVGRCTKGSACPFSHSGQPLINLIPCRFFAAGKCTAGADCRFSHEPSNEPCRIMIMTGGFLLG